MKQALQGIALSLVLIACGGESDTTTETIDTADSSDTIVFETGGPKAGTDMTAAIDWAAARADIASAGEADQRFVQIQSGSVAPPVPVLLPTGIVTAQSEGGGVMFRPTADGYFASYPGARYDVVMHGTNQVTTVNGEATARDDASVFTATIAGAQVALSRYGADYLIEFECNEFTQGSDTCIEEAEALAVAENLVLAGSR